MTDNTTDPFEAAAEGAGERWLNGDDSSPAVTSPLNTNEPIEVPPAEPAKRLRNRNGTTRRRGRPPRTAEDKAKAAPVAEAVVAVKVPPIKPEAIAPLIKQIDLLIVKLLKTDPLTRQEADEGAVAFAPVFDHYMPQLIEKNGMWIAPAVWVLTTYGVRAIERLEEVERQKKLRLGFRPVEHATEDALKGAGFSHANDLASSTTSSTSGNAPPVGTGL